MYSVISILRISPAARRWAPSLLSGWVMVWFLVALQPCCEAVAAALPHAHADAAYPDRHSHSGHGHEPHSTAQGSSEHDGSQGQEYCSAVEAPAQEAPAVTGGLASDPPAPDKALGPLPGISGLADSFDAKSSGIRISHRSPSYDQQYLVTLRLRL